MASASTTAPRPGATLPESIPLPQVDRDHLIGKEAFLLLFCAAFAGIVFFFWSWIKRTVMAGWPPGRIQPIENVKDILGPFLTAYIAARIYTAMVRRYERQLARHRLLLAHILDTSVDGIVTLDAADRISTWNRGAAQIFGWTESEILGRHASILYPPEVDPVSELKEIKTSVEKAGVLRAYDAERITKQSRRIRTEISTTVLRDSVGAYAGRASIVRDVTERDRIRSELTRKESLAAIGEMAAAIAHEIKNPLAGIGGAVSVIGRAFPAGDSRAEVIAEIQDQVHRLDETIRELLTFARPAVPRFGWIDLEAFLDRILRVLREEPELKRHRIVVAVPAGLSVRADPQLLENILLNLLLNAGEALGAKEGTIRVEAVEDTHRTRITVSDDGPGIPAEVYARLFKPFFTTKTRGTGLGLTIVRKFVEVMGGTVEVESEPGQGTVFSILLPKEDR